jgi:glutamine synthetase type III
MALREAVDAAEKRVADDHWPLAKYQELLYSLEG